MGVFRDLCRHNIPFRFCGLMFLFIPVGMLVALILYQCLTNMSTRLPLPFPGIVTRDVALTVPKNELVLVLSTWYYAVYFRSWLPHSCQYCHADIVILVRVIRNIVFITPSNALSSFPPQASLNQG
jgi:hypothetical protein